MLSVTIIFVVPLFSGVTRTTAELLCWSKWSTPGVIDLTIAIDSSTTFAE
jgi:hypothetical protein